MPTFLNAKSVRDSLFRKQNFEDRQLKVLLATPPSDTQPGRRDRIIMILGYDAGLHICEFIIPTLPSLHLDAEVPYVSFAFNSLSKNHSFHGRHKKVIKKAGYEICSSNILPIYSFHYPLSRLRPKIFVIISRNSSAFSYCPFASACDTEKKSE